MYKRQEYAHTGGRCSITGGYVYRGSVYPNLIGKYFFADVCTQEVGYLTFDGGIWNSTFETFSGGFVAFGEANNGELYVSTLGGNIFRLTDALLSIEESSLNSVSIFPNPAKNILNLDFSNLAHDSSAEINIYDLQGKIVMSKFRTDNPINTIDISALQNGFYILKIQTENATQLTKKFVIN